MKIYFEKRNETENIKIDGEMSLKDVLKKFNIVNESVILVKNGDVCLEDCMVNNDDEVKILSVISGG